MKHPHYEVMMEWASDTSKVVQWRASERHEWADIETPTWNAPHQYRIKTTPKPDVVRYLCHIRFNGWISYEEKAYLGIKPESIETIRTTSDGETGKLKKAEVLE